MASPECARKGTGDELNSDWCKLRRTFFPKIFAKPFSMGVRPESFFFGVEERGEEKNSLWLRHSIRTKSIMNHRSFLIKSELSGRIQGIPPVLRSGAFTLQTYRSLFRKFSPEQVEKCITWGLI